jgi:hypothetical protein
MSAAAVPLCEIIRDAATEGGFDLKALTVLARQNDPYRYDTTTLREAGEWFAAQANKHFPHRQFHLRGLHYRIVMAPGATQKPNSKEYGNTFADWKWLGKASQAARYLGVLPFERIIDERNDEPEIYCEDDDLLRKATAPGLFVAEGTAMEIPNAEIVLPRIDYYPGRVPQPYRIVIIAEKSSVRHELAPVASAVRGELVLPTGDISDTLLYGIASRAAADWRPTVVLYFADFDPGGHTMPIAVSRKLMALRDLLFPDLNIQVHRVALTREQVERLDLPSTPLKTTDSRRLIWLAKTGREQTELDALLARSGELRRLAWEIVGGFFDDELKSRAQNISYRWYAAASEQIPDSPNFAEACEEVTRALDVVREAVDQFHRHQSEAAKVLETTIPAVPRPAMPEPELAPAPPPLFDSNQDFVEASRALKADRIADDEDDE